MENHPLKIGTASGTLLGIMVNLTSDDLIKTAVLAFVGATFSFLASYMWSRWLPKK